MLKRCVLILTAAFAGWQCSNDLPVNAEWKDIAYVYGILDPRVDTQFVRIGKAFLGDAPPAEMAAESDSLYYKSIDVDLVVLNEDSVEQTRMRLERINMPGRMNDDGPFSTDDFHLYYTTEPIEEEFIYRLEISKPDGGPLVTAVSDIANWLNAGSGNVFDRPTPILNLANANRQPTNEQIQYTRPANASVHDVIIHIYYAERPINNPNALEEKYISYRMSLNELTDNAARGALNASNFYAILESRIPQDPTVLRFMKRINLEAVVGGTDMRTYVEVNRPSPGIAQEKPPFTNVTNGVGLFTSRNSKFSTTGGIVNPQIRDFQLNERSINYLVMELCDLNFVKAGRDSCYCDGGTIVRLGNSVSNCNL